MAVFKRRLALALAASAMIGSVDTASAFTRGPQPVATQSSDVTFVAQRREPDEKFQRRVVRLATTEAPGTIIIDTNNKFLYLVEGNDRAIRYGVGVGREGFGWSGIVKIGRKEEWPEWRPPKEMIAREARKGHHLPVVQKGGEDNPLGARAMYLYKGGRDTIFRIASVGKAVGTAAVMMLVEDGKLSLDEPVDRLLPELANRQVLKDLKGPITDTVRGHVGTYRVARELLDRRG